MKIRSKLILSYALVIALCLGLAALVSVVLLRNYQHTLTMQRLADIAEPVALILHEHATYDATSFDAGALLEQEARQTQTRMILVNVRLRAPGVGIVLDDTEGKLAPGATIKVPREAVLNWLALHPPGQAATTTPTATVPPVNARLSLPKPYRHSFALDGGAAIDLAAIPLRAEKNMPGFRVLIVTEREGPVVRPLARLAPPLAWAAAIAFLASILIALFLARSVIRPLVALTAATRAVSRGDYTQRVPVQGHDEVTQLATSFNAMAAEIERARRRERDFLANISHDLKTPLTSIQGFAGALVDGTCPPDAYPDAARIIHEESHRMARLVDDVLRLSRLEAGELPLHLAPLALAELLHDTARRFAPAALAAGVTIDVETPASPVVFLADRARLEQALGNLLDNALRYTPGGGRITLSGDQEDVGDGTAVRIAVRDTGSGIAAEDLPRVFERFYQADKARGAGRDGAGLGLAIVKELVESHGGRVTAESRPGAGTTIALTIPARAGNRRNVEEDESTITGTEATR